MQFIDSARKLSISLCKYCSRSFFNLLVKAQFSKSRGIAMSGSVIVTAIIGGLSSNVLSNKCSKKTRSQKNTGLSKEFVGK